MTRFLLRPRWIFGHVVIIAMVVLMANLSHWQWDRLQERKALNRQITAAQTADPVMVTSSALPNDAKPYANATATGTWVMQDSVYIRYPIVDGRQGYYVITPLRLSDGSALLVNRGWIPVEIGKSASIPADNGNIEVHLTGLLRSATTAEGEVGRTNGSPGVPTFTEADVVAIGGYIHEECVAPLYLQLRSPAGQNDPVPLAPPELNEGSHLSYALQWAAFCLIILAGWFVLLRKTFLTEQEEAAAENKKKAQPSDEPTTAPT